MVHILVYFTEELTRGWQALSLILRYLTLPLKYADMMNLDSDDSVVKIEHFPDIRYDIISQYNGGTTIYFCTILE